MLKIQHKPLKKEKYTNVPKIPKVVNLKEINYPKYFLNLLSIV